MKVVERSALVNFSIRQMFDLVNDVESYPQFMSGCRSAEILDRGENWMEVRMELQKAGLKQQFVTRNHYRAPSSLKLELVSGPFRHFRGEWQFSELAENACKVSFRLEYDFANALLAPLVGSLFEAVASEQVKCLCERAKTLY